MAAFEVDLPPAPWDLKGEFFAVGGFLPIARAKAHVPDDLEIVSVMPGMTLGAIALARYTEGSILTYSELVVVSAVVKAGGRTGGWISHIYVDHETSLQGGRSIWGLPKDLATFEWEQLPERGRNSTAVKVSQHGRTILDFWAAPRWFGVPTRFDLPVISRVDGAFKPWQAALSCRMRMTSQHLEIPEHAPFADLRPQTYLGIHGEDLNMRVFAPA